MGVGRNNSELKGRKRIMYRKVIDGVAQAEMHHSIWEATMGAHRESLRGKSFAVVRVDGEPLSAWQQRALENCIAARRAQYERSAA